MKKGILTCAIIGSLALATSTVSAATQAQWDTYYASGAPEWETIDIGINTTSNSDGATLSGTKLLQPNIFATVGYGYTDLDDSSVEVDTYAARIGYRQAFSANADAYVAYSLARNEPDEGLDNFQTQNVAIGVKHQFMPKVVVTTEVGYTHVNGTELNDRYIGTDVKYNVYQDISVGVSYVTADNAGDLASLNFSYAY